MTWKILEVYADDGLITSAKYHCAMSDEANTVETEGYWSFPDGKLNVPFDEVTEEMIAHWIEDASTIEGVNIIKSRLQEQLQTISKKPVPAPWLPQTFTL
jgi:hypothetical protein